MTVINKLPLAAIARRNNKFKYVYVFPLKTEFRETPSLAASPSPSAVARLTQRAYVQVNYSKRRNPADSLTVMKLRFLLEFSRVSSFYFFFFFLA